MPSKKLMSGYVVAIPSYNRAELLKTKTLAMLQKGGVDPKRIYVFVANKEEVAIYRQTLDPATYHKLVVGEKGITQQRRFIVRYFAEGQAIVSVDDDVEILQQLSADGEKLRPMTDVDGFFRKAFAELRARDLYLWGVYPTPNPFYMKGQKPVSTGLRFVIGLLHGFINRHDSDLRPSLETAEKEDVHLSILAFIKDGGLLRFNHVSFKTKFKAPGGLGKIEQRMEPNKRAAEFLAKTYPQYARIRVRKNGMYEITLREFKTTP